MRSGYIGGRNYILILIIYYFICKELMGGGGYEGFKFKLGIGLGEWVVFVKYL